MSQKILHKRSDLPDIKPHVTELDLGEIAINTHDGKIFIKKNKNNSEEIIEISGELKKVVNNDDTQGYRIKDRENYQQDNYGILGNEAIDFSYSDLVGDFGATGKNSFAEGFRTIASGEYSHAEGAYVRAEGNKGSHAEGWSTEASGYSSHAEGYETIALGTNSHSEGYKTTANGLNSHTEGVYTIANGDRTSHAEGWSTEANGDISHAEGYNTKADGDNSHSEGKETVASGNNSHAEGFGTIAQNNAMHVEGMFNLAISPDTIHETGIGTSDTNRKNAFEIYTDGKVVAPELTTALIDDTNTPTKVLVTKEWVEYHALKELNELEDVDADSPSDGQLIEYNASLNKWVSKDVIADGGIF